MLRSTVELVNWPLNHSYEGHNQARGSKPSASSKGEASLRLFGVKRESTKGTPSIVNLRGGGGGRDAIIHAILHDKISHRSVQAAAKMNHFSRENGGFEVTLLSKLRGEKGLERVSSLRVAVCDDNLGAEC